MKKYGVLCILIATVLLACEQRTNQEIVEKINKLYMSEGYSLDGFCSISGNIVSLDEGCGSCGHGAWEIGSVSYKVIYEEKIARITGERYHGHSLVITCNDGTSCISSGLNYTHNTGIYGDPWKEIKIDVSEEFGYQLIELLGKLTDNVPSLNVSTILHTFNAGNIVGDFLTSYDVKAILSPYEKEIVIFAKLGINPTMDGYDFSNFSKSIFEREIVKRTFIYKNYTYQDVLCKSGVNQVEILLIGPSGDFKAYTHYLSCL